MSNNAAARPAARPRARARAPRAEVVSAFAEGGGARARATIPPASISVRP